MNKAALESSSSPSALIAAVEADILKEITSVFFPYHKEPERSDPMLWLTIGEVQDKEIRLDLLKGDKAHAIKEFADRAFVAIDGLSKMGFDVRAVMESRLAEIRKKDMKDRDMAYYIAKGKRIDAEILNLLRNPPTEAAER